MSASIAPAVTKPFNFSITQQSGADTFKIAQERLTSIAAENAVKLGKVDTTGFVFETMPPQADVSGTVSGTATCVEHALTAIEALGKEL